MSPVFATTNSNKPRTSQNRTKRTATTGYDNIRTRYSPEPTIKHRPTMSLGRGAGINKPAWMTKNERDGPNPSSERHREDRSRSRSRSRGREERDQFGRSRGRDDRRRCATVVAIVLLFITVLFLLLLAVSFDCIKWPSLLVFVIISFLASSPETTITIARTIVEIEAVVGIEIGTTGGGVVAAGAAPIALGFSSSEYLFGFLNM